MTARPRVLVGADPEGAARLAAAEVVRRARGAVAARGRFVVALAGGQTPRRLHALLAGPYAGLVDWGRVQVLLGDERRVPPDHPASNYRMARETLLGLVPLPPGNVRRWLAEDPEPDRAAAAYEGGLRALFPDGAPRLDLALLGLGPDGHVASLFPGSPALAERRRWAVAAPGPGAGPLRLTLTWPVLLAARTVLLLAVGRDKAARAAEVLGGPGPLPAQRLWEGSGELVAVLDAGSAHVLRGGRVAETGPTGGFVV
ncbi:MAG TPA: 6-phosphogluconolactonase [Anaeromyxobacteraceae bacterium]|nr:6-phosphogluconolactonase [Anaeromyxobacteraceae bacterium]